MEARATWRGGLETRLEDGRGHVVTVDEPVGDGGHDAGTSPLELLVLSLAGCMSATFRVVAEKRHVPFEGLSISLAAEFSERAPTIERVRGVAEVRTEATPEEVETILRLVLHDCPVGALFHQANVPIELSTRILRPTTHPPAELPYEVPEPEWAL